jgi:hypothetical protein
MTSIREAVAPFDPDGCWGKVDRGSTVDVPIDSDCGQRARDGHLTCARHALWEVAARRLERQLWRKAATLALEQLRRAIGSPSVDEAIRALEPWTR